MSNWLARFLPHKPRFWKVRTAYRMAVDYMPILAGEAEARCLICLLAFYIIEIKLDLLSLRIRKSHGKISHECVFIL